MKKKNEEVKIYDGEEDDDEVCIVDMIWEWKEKR